MTSPVTRSRRTSQLVILALVLAISGTGGLMAQGGPGRGHMKGHMRGGVDKMEDMQLIHELLDNGAKITRTVTLLPDGVETVTESDDPALVQTIQNHVASMYRYKLRIKTAMDMGEFGLARVLQDVLVMEEEHVKDLQTALGL